MQYWFFFALTSKWSDCTETWGTHFPQDIIWFCDVTCCSPYFPKYFTAPSYPPSHPGSYLGLLNLTYSIQSVARSCHFHLHNVYMSPLLQGHARHPNQAFNPTYYWNHLLIGTLASSLLLLQSILHGAAKAIFLKHKCIQPCHPTQNSTVSLSSLQLNRSSPFSITWALPASPAFFHLLPLHSQHNSDTLTHLMFLPRDTAPPCSECAPAVPHVRDALLPHLRLGLPTSVKTQFMG